MINMQVVSEAVDPVLYFSLDHLPKNLFDSLPSYKFTDEDHAIMAAILGLRKNKKNLRKPKNKISTYIMPQLSAIAEHNDCKRSITQHQLKQELYMLKVEQEFTNNHAFRKEEIAKEKEENIDTSKFDENDFGVLELVNKIITGIDHQRDKAQKKSTNYIVKEAS